MPGNATGIRAGARAKQSPAHAVKQLSLRAGHLRYVCRVINSGPAEELGVNEKLHGFLGTVLHEVMAYHTPQDPVHDS
jgi:hypothetical protein